MARLALMTFGILHGPYGDPRVQGFVDRIDTVFAGADAAPGFVTRVPRISSPDGDGWTPPERFSDPAYQELIAATLSLWEDPESAVAFSYRGVHGEALRGRADWFEKLDGPNHVAWWQADEGAPSWADAVARFDRVWEAEGPEAFVLQRPFAADGSPYPLDRERVRRLADGA